MNVTERSWVLPEEPVPVRLMGTIWADGDGLHDDLDTSVGLAAWMDAVGIDVETLASRKELAEGRALRDALRSLAAHQTGDPRPVAAARPEVGWSIDTLNAAAERLPAPRLRLENNAFRRVVPKTTVRIALAGIASQAIELFSGPDSEELRACLAPGCVLYFIRSHPRREWCSVTCGNRARAARHYHRRRQAIAKPATD